MPSGALALQRLLEPEGRQSLVTPIDWKQFRRLRPRDLPPWSPILGEAY